MSLIQEVRQQNWNRLEESWTELMLGSAEIGPALAALELAAARKEIPRCVSLVREHADVLTANDRHAEAAELLGQAMLYGGSPGELGRPLYQAAVAAWGSQDAWQAFAELAGFTENAPDMRTAWRDLKKLFSLTPGRAVYHAKGWGLGSIEELDLASGDVTVRFASGRTDRFPFRTAVEIFEVLDQDDLRALVVRDPRELARRLDKEPLEVLRWVVRKNKGRANHAGIKLAMGTLGVEGSRFTSWWKKAKKRAEESAWFELSGPATRVQVRLLDSAEDPVEGLRRQLRLSKSLGEALTRVRGLLSGSAPQPEMQAAALETLDELALSETASLSERLSVWLFLREVHGSTPDALLETLRVAAAAPPPPDPSNAPDLWTLLQVVSTVREQERAVDLVRELFGERWLDEAARHLPHAAPGMTRPLVDALAAAGRERELVAHYVSLLARPGRNPTLFVQLAERVELGTLDGDLPAPQQRAQCLLQLAVQVNRAATGNATMTRVRARLTALLLRGDPPVLKRLLSDASIDTLRGFASMLESGVDRPVDQLFTKIAIDRSPEVFRGEDKPFWQTGGTWTTRRGLARREAELRELKDVRIPANSEAIGKAAAYGDLSENSEWEAAIEEQRILTGRAMEIESEVRDAQLLENASIPEGVVAPGTRVSYRELGNGRERKIRILGPWDGQGQEDVVSYRSPLAAGMLGHGPGERVIVELPNGQLDLEVLAVEILDLD